MAQVKAFPPRCDGSAASRNAQAKDSRYQQRDMKGKCCLNESTDRSPKLEVNCLSISCTSISKASTLSVVVGLNPEKWAPYATRNREARRISVSCTKLLCRNSFRTALSGDGSRCDGRRADNARLCVSVAEIDLAGVNKLTSDRFRLGKALF